jgi:hypothetical protein
LLGLDHPPETSFRRLARICFRSTFAKILRLPSTGRLAYTCLGDPAGQALLAVTYRPYTL